MPEAFFTVDGDTYVPSALTRGPWGATMGGQVVGGLMCWGIEQYGIDPEFQPARLTVDLSSPALLEPVHIQISVQREGRRIKLVDAALAQRDESGRVVEEGRALTVRTLEETRQLCSPWTRPGRRCVGSEARIDPPRLRMLVPLIDGREAMQSVDEQGGRPRAQ